MLWTIMSGWVFRALAASFIVSLIFGSGIYVGKEWGERNLHKAVADQIQKEVKLKDKRDTITRELGEQHQVELQDLKDKQEVLIVRVPEYVKDTCIMSDGVRLLHNLAAEGELPTAE